MTAEPRGEAQAIWDRNAPFWDEYMGPEGNAFQRVLIGPATEELLGLRPDEEVLDVACGSGIFSRRMAALGARVTAVDFSAEFLRLARGRSVEVADRIEYRQADATDGAALLALGPGRFDAAVCTMALMDMAEIDPLMRAMTRLLKPAGRFVFSVMHPCFNHNGMTMLAEREEREGRLVHRFGVKIERYLTPFAERGIGIDGQPIPQWYSHRPLGVLFDSAFRAGLVLDALREQAFDREPDPRRGPSWSNLTEIPPVLVARLRLR